MRYNNNNTFHFYILQIIDNKIGVKGGSAIAEALKTNNSLKELDLNVINNSNNTFHFHIFKLQGMKSELK